MINTFTTIGKDGERTEQQLSAEDAQKAGDIIENLRKKNS